MATEAELLAYARENGWGPEAIEAIRAGKRPPVAKMSLAGAKALMGPGTQETADEWYSAEQARRGAEQAPKSEGIRGMYESLGGDRNKPPLEDFLSIAGGLAKRAGSAVADAGRRAVSTVTEQYDPRIRAGLSSAAANISGDPAAIAAADANLERARAELPPASGGLLADQERAALDQAAREGGSGMVRGASPDAQRAAVLAALQGLGPRVVGMTKGGFQPSARGEQVQVESKVPSPDFMESLARFSEHGKAAAEGEAAVATEMQLLAQVAAERRAQSLRTQAQAEEQALQSEERARGFAEQRIQKAVADFEASAPRAENYGTLLEGRTDGERIGAVAGALLGMFGGAMTGKPSQFVAQLDSSIERRAKAAEAASRVKGAVVGMQENAYARLERNFADARAARSALRAIYTEQAKSELEAAAARVGVGAEHPRLQAALAQLEEKRLGYLRETASVVTQNARNEEKYAAPRAIMAGGVGKLGVRGLESVLDKDQLEALGKFEQELEKRGVHQAEQGVELMREGLNDMKRENPEEGKRFLLRLAATDPKKYGELFAQVAGSPGAQKYLEGYQRIRQADAGKALTGTELVSSANALGTADDQALEVAIYAFNRRIQDQYNALRAGPYGEAYKLYQLKKAYNASEGRSGGDIRGTQSPIPQTEGLPIAP